MKNIRIRLCYVTYLLLTLTCPAIAQNNYPAFPVKLTVGYPPGSAVDLIARLLAQRLSSQMHASVVVDNKPGAAGNIAAEVVLSSKPDGYALLFNTSGLITSGVILNRSANENGGSNFMRDLSPVSLVASGRHLIIINPSLPVNSIPEFINYAKNNPNRLTYGSGGTGSFSHLAVLLFLQSNNITAVHVPYKGTVPANLDVVAGRIQFDVTDVSAALPLLKEQRIKALAITSLKRLPLLPDVPTLAETNPGFEILNWYGVMAPAKTPNAVIQKLSSEIATSLQNTEMISRLSDNGAFPFVSTTEEYRAYLKTELERWGKVIKTADIKPE